MNRMRSLVQTVTGKGLSLGNLALQRRTQVSSQPAQIVPFPDPEQLNAARQNLDELRSEGVRFASAYLDLAIFPPNEGVPRGTVERLWKHTADLSDEEINLLLYSAARKDLIEITESGSIVIDTLHNNYIRPLVIDELPMLHASFLGSFRDGFQLSRWAELPPNELYLWDHLGYHLIESGRRDEFVATIKDMAYLAIKTYVRNAAAVEDDLVVAKDIAQGDLLVQLLHASYLNMKDAFSVCESLQDVAEVFLKQFGDVDALEDACNALRRDLIAPEVEPSVEPLPNIARFPRIRPARTLFHAESSMTCCAMSPDGSWVVAGAKNELYVADAQDGTLWMTLKGHSANVQSCAISPDGTWIASAGWDSTIRIWDVQTGAQLATLYGHEGWVNDCAISRDGSWLVSASQDGTLKVWDAQTGGERMTLYGHEGWVNACAITPDSKWIISASQDRTIRIWNSRTGDEVMVLEGHSGAVSDCAIDPQGEWIASASHDKTVRLWELVTGREIFCVDGFEEIVTSCVVSPDSEWIIAAAHDETLRIIDAQTAEVYFSLEGHNNWVTDCAISPGGYLIVSCSADKTLRSWKI